MRKSLLFVRRLAIATLLLAAAQPIDTAPAAGDTASRLLADTQLLSLQIETAIEIQYAKLKQDSTGGVQELEDRIAAIDDRIDKLKDMMSKLDKVCERMTELLPKCLEVLGPDRAMPSASVFCQQHPDWCRAVAQTKRGGGERQAFAVLSGMSPSERQTLASDAARAARLIAKISGDRSLCPRC